MNETDRENPKGLAADLRRRVLPVLLTTLLVGCMSADEYKQEADEQAYGVLGWARKAAEQSEDPDFTIEREAVRLRDTLIKARSLDEEPGPRERLALTGAVVTVDLASALEIAARNSREFQSEKERLYRSALSLTGRWWEYQNRFFGTSDIDFAALGDGDDDSTVSIAENGSFGFTRLLETGGALSLAIGENITRFLSNPTDTIATTFASLTLNLPFLRGAGRLVAYERVTQAERNVVYSVRDYERFKREFAVSVISEYLRLLQVAQTLENEEGNLKRRRLTAAENRALGLAGRLARTDVERANQAELDAENRLVVSRQSYSAALDRFKLTLGLPTDCLLEIDRADLQRVLERGVQTVDVEDDHALLVALENRLDLANVHGDAIDARRQVGIAKNALLAVLDVNVGVDLNSNDFADDAFRLDPVGSVDYRLGFDFELPFDRRLERNAYRSAIIDYQAALRSYEAFEDQVKLQVRDAMRDLSQAAESHRIQVSSLAVSESNVDAATLRKDAGIGNTLDLLDAQNDLIQSQNSVLAALINYRISELRFYRDLGVLTVNSSGIDREMTLRRLELEEGS